MLATGSLAPSYLSWAPIPLAGKVIAVDPGHGGIDGEAPMAICGRRTSPSLPQPSPRKGTPVPGSNGSFDSGQGYWTCLMGLVWKGDRHQQGIILAGSAGRTQDPPPSIGLWPKAPGSSPLSARPADSIDHYRATPGRYPPEHPYEQVSFIIGPGVGHPLSNPLTGSKGCQPSRPT